MSKIDHNISYILIPFQYDVKNKFENLIHDLEQKRIKFTELNFSSELLLGYVDALYNNTKHIRIEGLSEETEEIQLVLFGTGIGFILFKYIFPNGADCLSIQSEKIEKVLSDIKGDKCAILNQIRSVIQRAVFFPASIEKNALVYNFIVSKISKTSNCDFINECEHKYDIDKLHEYYCSSNNLSIVTNQHYGNLCEKQEDVDNEQRFRDKYENALLIAFLLLHHERRAYLVFRQQIIVDKNGKAKNIRKIKNGIMDLLSCYSFTLLSEDVSFQSIYTEYRGILNLSEYETTLSELIFRLVDELEKAKEMKFTFISIVIAIFGLIQLIPLMIDFIKYLNSGGSYVF